MSLCVKVVAMVNQRGTIVMDDFGPKTNNTELTPEEELQLMEAYQDELNYLEGLDNPEIEFDTED